MTPNLLKHETSPYLLQHADNPVRWMPWGEAAFERSRAEDKPVFLSAGYSSCHWCHVMAHESFEDEGIAELLNDHFVCVKLDREERPDVDALYMQATQILTGRGGWPNSVFLLPDHRPFYAGTYWPKEDRGGYAGFRSLLRQLAAIWKEKRDQVREQADAVTERIRAVSTPEPAPAKRTDPLPRLLEELRGGFDAKHGGFGGAPKFPPHTTLLTLLSLPEEPERDAWLRATLDAMALGGIRDQAGGAFHRYATDAEWFLPHFEVMLYDNAQLADVYALAASRFDSREYAEVARGICDAMLRDFGLEGGVFATAWDADSEGGEGDYYLWPTSEIQQVLGDRTGEFCRTFQVVDGGNAHDEATGHPLGKNILHPKRFPDDACKTDLGKLLGHRRDTRTPPFKDDKVLTAWNGLMIRGLAVAGRELRESRYTEAAHGAADTLWEWNQDGMRRSFRQGKPGPAAVLEDFTFFAHGLIAVGEEGKARQLMGEAEARFRSPEGGYFLSPTDGEQLLVSQQDPYDNATPSAAGIAVQVWRELGENKIADRIRKAYSGAVERSGYGTQSLWRR